MSVPFPLHIRKKSPKFCKQKHKIQVTHYTHKDCIVTALRELPEPTPSILDNDHTDLIPAELKLSNGIQHALDTLKGPVLDIFRTQMIYGLRVGEILSIKNKDFLSNGLIHINGSKKSNDRFIYIPELLKYHNAAKNFRDYKVFILSYQAYYKQLKKIGFSFPRERKNSNNIVSHACRKHVFNYVLDELDIDINSQQNFSGHKSLEGLQYYKNRAIKLKKG